MTLDQLKVGSSAIISAVGGNGALRCRLLDMGLIPQTRVHVNKVAPMGDPMELQLRACEETSILLSMENLMSFPWIRKRVEAGRLKIHGWYFNMKNGELYDYDSEKEEFLPLDNGMEFL